MGSEARTAAAISIPELDGWRADLAKTNNPAAFRREFTREEKKIAGKVATAAKGDARGMGGPFAKFAGYIYGAGTTRGASVALRGKKANATFWGAKRHTGWYANPRYSDSPPQHPKWVGASWQPGVAGTGPYAINNAVAASVPLLPHWYGEAVDRVTHQSFPDTGGESF